LVENGNVAMISKVKVDCMTKETFEDNKGPGASMYFNMLFLFVDIS
jgi:hypothetical protein